MTDISFLLGAGFSVPAEYRKASELNEELISFKSDEIFIDGSGDSNFLNGQIDHNAHLSIPQRDFVTMFISFYVNKFLNGSNFNYEHFYDHYKELQRKNIKSKEFNNFIKEYKQQYRCDTINTSTLIEQFNNTFNQLIGHLLSNPKQKISNTCELYNAIFQFTSHLASKGIVHTHTLNHDLLYEKLVQCPNINITIDNGFEFENSPYFGKTSDGGFIQLECFTAKYEEKVRLYKLHGSIDQIKFTSRDNSLAAIKTKDNIGSTQYYREYEVEGELKRENCWINYYSDFLSGTTEKIRSYNHEYYYRKLFELFKENLKKSNLLVIVGYSFGDNEINKMINSEFTETCEKRIIVIDPYMPDIDSFLKCKNKFRICKSISEITVNELIGLI